MTKSDLYITRKRLENQGYFDIDNASLARIKYWLRLTPAICSFWVLLGTLLHSPVILWTFVPVAFLGAFLPGNPFDMIYNYGFRYLFKGPPASEVSQAQEIFLPDGGDTGFDFRVDISIGFGHTRLYSRWLFIADRIFASKQGSLYSLTYL
jgi:hypothetical protein